MNKEFKKGDRVYVHSYDTRNNSYEAIVTSVGRKYITCNQIWGDDGSVSDYGDKFDIEHLRRVDYGSFYLYHSVDDFNKEQEAKKIKRELVDKMNRSDFSLEELKTFMEIHEIGLDNWIKKIKTT
jgi:hypothetical protein